MSNRQTAAMQARLTAYAEARDRGLSEHEAQTEVGLTDGQRLRYERAYRRMRGLSRRPGFVQPGENDLRDWYTTTRRRPR